MATTEATSIDGNEAAIDPATPRGALADFYRAFNGRDLAGLEANWLANDEVVMDNPLGGITRGWPAIRATYEKLVSGEGRVAVEFHDYSLLETRDVFVAIGRERGTFSRGGKSFDLAIRTSRWFHKIDGRWRQVHHHGSIDDPDLLRRYQQAIKD